MATNENSTDTRVAQYYVDNFIRAGKSSVLLSVTNPREDNITVYSAGDTVHMRDTRMSDVQIYSKPNYQFPNGMICDAHVMSFRSGQVNGIRKLLQVHSSPRRILTNSLFLLLTMLLLLLCWRQLQTSSN